MAFDCLADASGALLAQTFGDRRTHLDALLGRGKWPGVILTKYTRSAKTAKDWLGAPSEDVRWRRLQTT